MSPRDRVAEAVRRYGQEHVAIWCAELLSGQTRHDATDRPSLEILGGPHGASLIPLEDLGAHEYWPRVWGARGLLYTWSARAVPAVVGALDDPAWRVREMVLKVVRLREVGEAGEAAAQLIGDEVTRVRVAALRALAIVGEGEHAELIRDAIDDPEVLVRHTAISSLGIMRKRLERPL